MIQILTGVKTAEDLGSARTVHLRDLNRMRSSDLWPPLPLHEWQDTYHTLHMWTQIVGKIRMALCPPMNHWWHVTLYVNSRGLTTGPIPYPPGIFEIQFDFQKHEVIIFTSEGASVSRPLRAEPVADFYKGIFETLASLGISVEIDLKPQEVADAVPFDRDIANCSYDAQYAQRFWRILVSTSKVLQRFRAKFIGKCSPVHFFWGSFDLACTRFSGRPAPSRKVRSVVPHIRTKYAAPAFGPEAALSKARHIIRISFLSQPALRAKSYVRRRRVGTRSFRNSFLCMMMCDAQNPLTNICTSSWRALTMLARVSPNGIARR